MLHWTNDINDSAPQGSDIFSAVGSAPRAVGQAGGANWFALVISCHLVTAALRGTPWRQQAMRA